MTDQRTVVLIDLSSLYWANWHATADMELSEAYKRTLAHVREYSAGFDLTAVCCDSPPYWRKDVLPEYKANREAAPPLAVEQFKRVKERLAADGFLLWAADGFEADDLLCAASSQALSAGHRVRIISSDKDLHQLVCDGIEVQSPMSGTVYDEAGVQAKHGVEPAKVVDYLALVGDKSDNVPGVPGIGPKTAAALLNHFGTLDAVLKAAATDHEDLTKPKMKAALKEYADTARKSAKVIALRIDAPVKWSEIYMERTPKNLTTTNTLNLDADDDLKPDNGNGNGHHVAEPVTLDPPVVQPPQPAKPGAAIVLRPDEWSLALEPRSSKGAWEAAGILMNSRLYANFGSQEAIYVVIMRGRALGMDATTSLATFHNIQGRLAMHADLISALVLRSGKAEYFEIVESDARHATCATKRIGGSGRERQLTFTIEDAYHGGMVEKHPDGRDGFRGVSKSGQPSAWDKTRATMLAHRARTMLAREVYPDVVLGLYSPDEVDGIDATATVTARAAV